MPRAEIASKQAAFTLERLHAELGGKILDNKAEAKRLATSMRHVEEVLKLLQPGYDTRPIAVRRRKANPWFKRGTVFRSAVDVLRTVERPLTTLEIARRMLTAKGVQGAPGKGLRVLAGAVQASMRNNRGAVVTAHGEHPTRWALARE